VNQLSVVTYCRCVSVETHGSGGAGSGGKFTVDVSLNGRSVPAKVEPETDNRYHVSFVPIGSGVYTIRIYYAGVEVTGEMFEFCGKSDGVNSRAML